MTELGFRELPGGVRGRDARFIAERVHAVATPIVRSFGLELVDVECVGRGARTLVRVFIDKPGGVNLDDCQQVHVSLGHALDVEDPIPHAYTLEVSSPGLDRPFKRREQYQRFVGKLVSLKLTQPVDGQWRVVGRLLDVNDEGVTLAVTRSRAEQTVPVQWAMVAEGRPVVEF